MASACVVATMRTFELFFVWVDVQICSCLDRESRPNMKANPVAAVAQALE
jgi:hypothetical protein